MPSKRSVPVVMTIAGSDNSGGAGIQADLKTFTSLGVYGTSAITCVVAENPRRVQSIHAIPPNRVREQMELIFESFPVAAIKTGMLYSPAIIRAVAALLAALPSRRRPCLVVDPVMVATSGALLMKPSANRLLVEKLFPLAAVVTPNLDETAVLTGGKTPRTLEQAMEAAWDLQDRHGVPFLVKGGHLRSHEAVDILCGKGSARLFRGKRISGVRTHGTGCTYSAAIAAFLARGQSLEKAVAAAKSFVTRAIRDHHRLGGEQVLNQLP